MGENIHLVVFFKNYIDSGLFDACNINLPRKVRFRPRKKSTVLFKVDKKCRIGRTYDDFLSYMLENPDTSVVEMDSVEGVKGGKVLLFEDIGPETFKELFPVILTDNGIEFSNPAAIEFDSDGCRRTRVFFCNPSAPYQKGAAENNHSPYEAFSRHLIWGDYAEHFNKF